MNKNHRPSASLQSVTSRCRPSPANWGLINYPPGLGFPETTGIPSVGPAPDGYSTIGTSGSLLKRDASIQIGTTVDSMSTHHRIVASSHDTLPAPQVGVSQASATSPVARALASLFMLAHPDSGCTGSITPDVNSLINRRPCSDTFRAANKKSPRRRASEIFRCSPCERTGPPR